MSLTPSLYTDWLQPVSLLMFVAGWPSFTIPALIKPLHMLAGRKMVSDRKSLSKSSSSNSHIPGLASGALRKLRVPQAAEPQPAERITLKAAALETISQRAGPPHCRIAEAVAMSVETTWLVPFPALPPSFVPPFLHSPYTLLLTPCFPSKDYQENGVYSLHLTDQSNMPLFFSQLTLGIQAWYEQVTIFPNS